MVAASAMDRQFWLNMQSWFVFSHVADVNNCFTIGLTGSDRSTNMQAQQIRHLGRLGTGEIGNQGAYNAIKMRQKSRFGRMNHNERQE